MMRRGFLIGACMLLASASVSRANYLIVRVILNPPATPSGGVGGNNNEGGPGAAFLGGSPAQGGAIGSQPGGGGIAPPTGMIGGGGRPPIGIGGIAPPSGMLGARGGPAGEGAGPGGPGRGGFGMFGNLGGGPGRQGNQSNPQDKPKLTSADYVMVAVEFKEKDVAFGSYIEGNKLDSMIKTKWGDKVVLYQDGQEIYVQAHKLATPYENYVARMPRVKRQPDELLKFAQWCQSVGLVDECMKILDEYVKAVENTKEADNEKHKTIAAIYSKLRPELSRGVLKKDSAVTWKNRLGGNFTTTDNEFYSLIHASGPSIESSMIQRRLKLLDTTLKNFYLWHAMKGKELPLPEEKLVAVLIDSEPRFRQYKSTFDAEDLVSDGFHARRDNLAIFYSGRLDLGYQNFKSKVKSLAQEYKPEELMKGLFPKEAKSPKQRQEAARAAMLFLVDKALQEEAEIASTSHEGARQLFAATGLLPRHVDIPEWLRFGLASLFEMPKGPFYGDFTEVKVALWPGVGMPSWAYMGHFNELVQKKELGRPLETLVDTITDDFFVLAREGIKSRKEIAKTPMEVGKLEELKEELLARAHTLSWGLAYYVSNDPERLPQLHNYFAELSKLPRDLELDENAKQLAFAKAFGLSRPGLTTDGIDPRKLNAFALNWMAYMQTLRAPTAELKLDEVTAPTGGTGGSGLGGEGGSPGGLGGSPGGLGGSPGGPGGPGR